jgi:alpha-1,2-mannosyltransferase
MYGPLPPTISGMALPFIYPPFAAMLLAPFAFLPWTVAWVLLLALSLGSLAATLYVTARQAWPDGGPGERCRSPRWHCRCCCGSSRSGDLRVRAGQPRPHGLVAVDLPGAAHALAARACWSAVAAAIKLTPAAFVLFFLLRRDAGRPSVTVVTGRRRHRDRVRRSTRASSARYWFGGPASGVSGSVFYTNQTIQAVLARAEVPALAAKAVWLGRRWSLLALIVPVVRRAEPALALVTVAGFALLESPTSWSHHWVWIAPALLVFVAEAVRRRSRGWAAAALCWP